MRDLVLKITFDGLKEELKEHPWTSWALEAFPSGPPITIQEMKFSLALLQWMESDLRNQLHNLKRAEQEVKKEINQIIEDKT